MSDVRRLGFSGDWLPRGEGLEGGPGSVSLVRFGAQTHLWGALGTSRMFWPGASKRRERGEVLRSSNRPSVSACHASSPSILNSPLQPCQY